MKFTKIAELTLRKGWDESEKRKQSLLKWLNKTIKNIESDAPNLSKRYKTSLELVS
jgi:hypothetical protein